MRVIDHGPGVPEALRDEIFQPFQRYDDAGQGEGMGLGLAVARGFAEAMAGELTIEATPGGGATLVLILQGAG